MRWSSCHLGHEHLLLCAMKGGMGIASWESVGVE
jgi:hypothetical protein